MKHTATAATLWMALLSTSIAADLAPDSAASASATPAAASAASSPDGAASPSPAPSPLEIPAGAMVRTDDTSLAYFAAAKATIPNDLAIYRPGPNMPEASPQLLRDQITKTSTTDFLGYMPRLRVTGCAQCKGSDFSKIMKHFLKGLGSYTDGPGKVEYRGELPIEIRWFNIGSSFLPTSTSQFGISYVYEGKLISMGRSTAVGSASDIYKKAEDLGLRLGYELLFRIGAGLKPQTLMFLDAHDTSLRKANLALGAGLTHIHTALGGVDARSRIEPVDPARHAHLLPAIDGIQPGEVRPITETVLIPNM
ncbi:MAG: hypothetical protein ACOZE7_21545 [Pseudomonadota bacterium]